MFEQPTVKQRLIANGLPPDQISKYFNLAFSITLETKLTIYLLLTEFEGRTVSYGPSFFLLDLWPKREVRGP